MTEAALARPYLAASLPAGSGAERVLADMADRWLRHPQDKIVVVLHLSRLAAPAPRPHHARVALVLMQDCAQRAGGQVLVLPNQDHVLLCALPRAPGETQEAPAQLKATLARLFEADVPDPARLISFWRLGADSSAFRAFVTGLVDGVVASREPRTSDRPISDNPTPDSPPLGALSLAALEEIAAHAPLAELLVQQTGMALNPDRTLPLASRLKPCFRTLGVSLTALNLRPVVVEALSDPYLMHHFSARLDKRLIRVLHDDLQSGGRLTRVALHGGLQIHVSLSLEAILTPGFARMSRLARDAGVQMAIEVGPMQACVENELLENVRSLFGLAGFELIVGPLDAAMLMLLQPAVLRPDVVKLVWSQHLADSVHDPHGSVAMTLARIGFHRIVLQGLESEHGLAWGQARGIRRFQGAFFDNAQAAARMAGCQGAPACTLRQCVSRAGSLGIAGRAGCTMPALLDSASMPGASLGGRG